MGNIVISMEGVVIKEVQITKEKTTLGRRPYHDIVIDNLTVSGEHAALHLVGADVFIEDLNSTNGTYINGKAIKRQMLVHNDTVEIGKYKIKYRADQGADYQATQILRSGAAAPSAPSLSRPSRFGGPTVLDPMVHSPASIRVLNGAAAGREVSLVKVVTTIGKPGVQVASITKRPTGYVFAHVEGAARPTINGKPLVTETMQLQDGDAIGLAGTEMQFINR